MPTWGISGFWTHGIDGRNDSAEAVGTGRAPRILIYEDDPSYAYALSVLLRQAGYEATVATHFATALGELESTDPPDVLIAEIVVPTGEVNGLAMARMARMKNRKIKVLYVTAYDLTAEIKLEAVGPILQKPVANDELIAEVRRLCDNGQSEHAPASNKKRKGSEENAQVT